MLLLQLVWKKSEDANFRWMQDHIRPLIDLSSLTLSISLLKMGITLSIHLGEQKSLI